MAEEKNINEDNLQLFQEEVSNYLSDEDPNFKDCTPIKKVNSASLIIKNTNNNEIK